MAILPDYVAISSFVGRWIYRAEYEIYIGNYPVRFKEEDLRDLFKEHNIEVGVIRLKHDGQKV